MQKKKDTTLERITEMLSKMGEEKLKFVYHFILHLYR